MRGGRVVSVRLKYISFAESLVERLRQPPIEGIELFWLGQAGFLIRTPAHAVLIDPYLSDTLAMKYRGTPLPHVRMMSAPIDIAELGNIDLVLCTHHHTDHMDPGTLAPLARRYSARFVVPAASRLEAMKRTGVGKDRLICANAGEAFEPLPGLIVRPVRSAHETLRRDDSRQYYFLGYGIEVSGMTLFHSGDCVPFAGQIEEVRALGADLALLPVNGRSAELAARGVPGNFFLGEATALARDCGASFMLAHHYGMFDFNTIDVAEIEREASRDDLVIEMSPARLGVQYALTRHTM